MIKISDTLHNRLFKRNLTLFASVVIFIAALVGFVFMILSMNEIRAYTKESRLEKMKMAANDLQVQMDTMQDIALRIKTSYYFTENYERQGNYYETVSIKRLSNYTAYIPYNATLYLFNRNNSYVYSTTSKYIYPYFMDYVLKKPQNGEVGEYLYVTASVTFLKENDSLYVFFPINVNNSYMPGGDNCVLFVLSPNSITKRFEELTGIESGLFSVTWKDDSLVGKIENDDKLDKMYVGDFIVSMDPEKDPSLILLVKYRNRLWRYTIFALLLAVFAAIIVSLRVYEPIHRLTSRYVPDDMRKGLDEIGELENIIDKAIDDADVSRREVTRYVNELKKRNDMLKHQMLRLIVQSGYETIVSSKLQLIGIEFSYPAFCVFLCSGGDVKLIDAIENSYLENASLYVTYISTPGNPIVIANMENECCIPDICGLLESEAKALGEQITIRCGTVVYNIDEISRSYLFAGSDKARYGEYEFQSDEIYDDSQLKMAMNSICTGTCEEALSHIRMQLDIVESEKTQEIKRQYAYANIVMRLNDLAKRYRLSIPYEMIGMVFLSVNSEEIGTCIMELVRTLCNGMTSTEQKSDKESSVLRYIAASIDDPQLDANKITEKFRISARQISQITKDAAGLGYREYVIKLRIGKAKQLLEETELSISEISAMTGYSSVPYFIKAFKNATGYTPGDYRSNISGQV